MKHHRKLRQRTDSMQLLIKSFDMRKNLNSDKEINEIIRESKEYNIHVHAYTCRYQDHWFTNRINGISMEWLKVMLQGWKTIVAIWLKYKIPYSWCCHERQLSYLVSFSCHYIKSSVFNIFTEDFVISRIFVR